MRCLPSFTETRLMRRSAPSALHFGLRLDRALSLELALPLGVTRSGSFAPPVSRFHSSKVWLEILPSTRSCANFLRWAWLLNGISRYPPLTSSVGTVRTAIWTYGTSPAHSQRRSEASPRLILSGSSTLIVYRSSALEGHRR